MKNTTDKANAEVIDTYSQVITNGCVIRYQGENYTTYKTYDGLAINLYISGKYEVTLLKSLDRNWLELLYTPYFDGEEDDEIQTPQVS